MRQRERERDIEMHGQFSCTSSCVYLREIFTSILSQVKKFVLFIFLSSRGKAYIILLLRVLVLAVYFLVRRYGFIWFNLQKEGL